jgi:hypothetical protein
MFAEEEGVDMLNGNLKIIGKSLGLNKPVMSNRVWPFKSL